MARGKNATAAAARARGEAQSAADALRAETIRANRAERVVAERDIQIAQLEAALRNSRTESTVLGTHTDADMERAVADEHRKHREAIRAAFLWLEERDAVLFPTDPRLFAELVQILDCEPSDLFAGVENDARKLRRMTRKNLNRHENYRTQARAQGAL